MFDRAIVHMDLDAFFVSVECLKNDELKGRPLIIGGSSSRGVVASCSYEARKYGVHSAMPVKMAKRLCPQAMIIRGDMESYSKHSRLVTEIIADSAPLFEKSSIDEFYLDVTGMDKYFGCYKWSSELRQKIMRESGLPISFGLSINKLVSKVGTGEAKPNGSIQITKGRESDFLNPLSTKKIPGVGKKTYKKLSFMGVRTVKTLSEIPRQLLVREFGKQGDGLWKKSHGKDNRPVIPYEEQKSMSKERTFKEDTLNLNHIRAKITSMCEDLAYELRESQKLTACITVKIRYADFNTYTKQQRIPYTSLDKEIIKKAQDLFDKLHTKRQLIRLIGVRLSHLVHGHQQIRLFEDTVEEIHLMNAMDGIKGKFGSQAVRRASGIEG